MPLVNISANTSQNLMLPYPWFELWHHVHLLSASCDALTSAKSYSSIHVYKQVSEHLSLTWWPSCLDKLGKGACMIVILLIHAYVHNKYLPTVPTCICMYDKSLACNLGSAMEFSSSCCVACMWVCPMLSANVSLGCGVVDVGDPASTQYKPPQCVCVGGGCIFQLSAGGSGWRYPCIQQQIAENQKGHAVAPWIPKSPAPTGKVTCTQVEADIQLTRIECSSCSNVASTDDRQQGAVLRM